MTTQADIAGSRACYVAPMQNPWDRTAFRRLLQRVMRDTGLGQQEIADLAQVSRSQVSRWQSAAHRPNYDAILRLAAALRASHPETAGLADELVAAAGYDAPPPPSGDGDRVISGLSEEEWKITRAFLDGLRARQARTRLEATLPPGSDAG